MCMGGRCQRALFDMLGDEQEVHRRESGIKNPAMAVWLGMDWKVAGCTLP